MLVTRFHFGESVSLSLMKKDGGLTYWYGNKYWHLGETRREARREELEYVPAEPQRGPFERMDFGDRDRLSWPCGACAMQQDVTYASWGNRYAMWLESSSVCVVDATRTLLARLHLPMVLDALRDALFHDGNAYVQSSRDVLVLPLAALEGFFDRTSGPLDVQVREHYPHHRPTAKAELVVDWIFDDHASLVDRHGDHSWVRIPLVPGLERGETVTLYDELMKHHYREIEVPGYGRTTLHEQRPSELAARCELVVEPAIDPAGPLVKASTAARTEELDRVFGLLADDPDDDAARIVVVDLLEEAGEPYAPQLAKLLAGETDADARRDALGTLASYITDVTWRGNLPWAGELSPAAPNDPDIGDLVAADHRLGFFHALRLGEGNFRLYSKLVASPRAAGLRHVDGSRAAILQALIAAGRRNLRRLSNVKFATREVNEALADSTFDHVTEIETVLPAVRIASLLVYIKTDEHAFFARAPRHLIVREQNGDDDALVPSVLRQWGELPLDKLTMGGVTIARDGTARADADASDFIRKHVAAQFRFA